MLRLPERLCSTGHVGPPRGYTAVTVRPGSGRSVAIHTPLRRVYDRNRAVQVPLTRLARTSDAVGSYEAEPQPQKRRSEKVPLREASDPPKPVSRPKTRWMYENGRQKRREGLSALELPPIRESGNKETGT